MKLIITEKPSVARDIAKVLKIPNKQDGFIEGNGYVVSWALGHLIELCQPDEYNESYKKWDYDALPIIPDQFKKKIIASSSRQFDVVKSCFGRNDIDSIICATDAGREGELIFRLIYEEVGCSLPIQRLWISSQTDSAIKEGFAKLKDGKDYEPLFDSARCRSEADWIVGINVTRAYSIKFSRGHGVMSVGRVQTPVLKMIVDRYRDHINFDSKPFYEVLVDVKHDNGTFQSKWFNKESDRTTDKAAAEQIKTEIEAAQTCIISSLNKKTINEKAPLLYDLTELQKEANRQFKYSADQTLKLAQSLYETHKLLSYPRTSSRYLSTDMKEKLPGLLEKVKHIPDFAENVNHIQEQNLNMAARMIDDKKVTDHHGIIPTDKTPDISRLSEQEKNIYDLVIRRFVASFYPECEKDHTEIIATFDQHLTKATGTIIQKLGWRELYQHDSDEKADKKSKKKEKELLLPIVNENDVIKTNKTHVKKGQTKAPALHTEASILAAMETAGKHIDDEELRQAMKHCGLGTPATRAQILEKLINVGYIQREKNKLIPTQKAEYLIDCVKEQALLSAELTGDWEKKLNDMADGAYQRGIYMEEIKEFTADVINNVGESNVVAIKADQKVYGPCPKCEEGKVIETQKSYGCTHWKEKECKFVIWKNIAQKDITEKQVEKLLKEGKTGIIKGFKNKQGNPFDAALELVEGEVKMNFDREALAPCPTCENGNIVETAKAYSCDQWRDSGCKFVIWKEIAKRKLSKEEALTLIKDKELKNVTGFTSKAGKEFSASLAFRDNKVQFVFEN